MGKTYGTHATNLHAIIGPSIGPDSFQVGQEVVVAFQQASFPIGEIVVKTEIVGAESTMHHAQLVQKSYIDLWKANSLLLEEMGLRLHCRYRFSFTMYKWTEDKLHDFLNYYKRKLSIYEQ